MAKPKRECGSCFYWRKSKNQGQGLCELLDSFTYAQEGKSCPQWKGKKYNRLSSSLGLHILEYEVNQLQ